MNAEYVPDERDVASVMLAVMTRTPNVTLVAQTDEQAKAVFAEAKRRLERFYNGVARNDADESVRYLPGGDEGDCRGLAT